MKKFLLRGLIAVATCLVGSSMEDASAAAVVGFSADNTVPSVNVLSSQGNNSPSGTGSNQQTFAYRNADAAGTEGTRGRGQSFIIDQGASAYNISKLSVALGSSSGDGSQGAGTLDFNVFTFGADVDSSTDWLLGDGTADGDLLNGTGFTSVLSQTFTIAANTVFDGNTFLEIDFASGDLTLNEDTAYGFFFQYKLDDVTGLTADVTMGFDADVESATPGFLLNTGPGAASAVSETRSLNYFVQGTVAVPEPSSLAVLVITGVGVVARRRRR